MGTNIKPAIIVAVNLCFQDKTIIQEPLNKFRGSAAQGCAAIFQRHKSLENGANRKSHFSICMV